MTSNRQIALISITSGALSVASYILIKKLFFTRCPFHQTSNTNKKVQEQSKIYEEKELVDQYMLFNFAEGRELLMFDDLNEKSNVTNCFLFPKRVALLCRDYCPDIFFSDQTRPRSALDVGCAVGRSCFELSKLFDSVIGIDYSANFIKQCNRLLEEKEMDYECKLEGDIYQKLRARLDSDVNVDRIKFEVGDACNLREDLGQFDLVLASNLICRLTEPQKFLSRLKTLVKKNGYVILSTPFTWGEQFTPKENWLGGYYNHEGKEVTGLTGLQNSLNDSFNLVNQLSLPMFIRETRRKFQYTVCLVTIWQKK